MNSVENILKTALKEHKGGCFLQAERKYLQILRLHPNHADAKHLLGVTFLQREIYDRAIPHLEQAVGLNPQSAAFRSNLGAAYRSSGKPLDAVNHLKIAAELAPSNPGILYNLGNACSDLKNYPQAAILFRRSLDLDDTNADVWNNYGLALNRSERVTESIRAHRNAIRFQPNFPEAHFNLGNALRADESYREAMDAYQIAIDQRPNYSDAWANLGHTQDDLGFFDDALRSYETAIEHDHNLVEAHFNLSLLWLREGELKKGWEKYDWRLERPAHSKQWQNHRRLTQDDLQNGNILVVAEQGIGDEVMFASCISDLQKLNANITLECDHRLVPIFLRSFPEIKIVARGTSQNRLSDYRMIAMASLPRIFRNDFDNFSTEDSFLRPDENKSRNWQSILTQMGSGLKVGISWRGGNERHAKKSRSLALEEWKPLLQQRGIHWINLQYGSHDEEIQQAERFCDCRINRFSNINPLQELDDFFALISQLDLVISIDNATVHFAGSLGTPVWTMLPFNSDWRWFSNRAETPWYPSMKLYQQKTLGDWSPVLNSVAGNLNKLTIRNSQA